MRLRNKKTGEIIDDGYVRETHDFQFDGQKHVLAVFKGNGHNPPERVSGAYKSLAELNEEWEDAPAEPLIKDEKVRNLVRAWAEVCEIESDDGIMTSDLAPTLTRFSTTKYEIDIKTESSLGLDEFKDYTIAELCGEEE